MINDRDQDVARQASPKEHGKSRRAKPSRQGLDRVARVMDRLNAAYCVGTRAQYGRLSHGTNVVKPQFEPHTQQPVRAAGSSSANY